MQRLQFCRAAVTAILVVLMLPRVAALAAESVPSRERIKVIVDQDSAGPHGTNFLSLLMLGVVG